MLMNDIITILLLTILGLSMGSFAGATVWRLRARQLVEDKADGEEVDAAEYKKLHALTKASFTTDRSRCLHCGHELRWYDLIPLASWISTGGKCRYCHVPIGWFEPVIELGTAVFFVASFLLWPEIVTTLDGVAFALWLVAGVLLAILVAYDMKWSLLPNEAVFPLIGVGAVVAIVRLFESANVGVALLDLAAAISILSGLYLLLWYVSKGKWIGFGDIKLGLALALLLGDWQLAFLALFLANLVGCLVVAPGLLTGKLNRGAHIPFGPLLIIGFVIAALAGQYILQLYFTIFL
jgi:leader peptidase (prepilin peptidase)/N-methyltransferase